MTTLKEDSIPPEGCICASFWTVRQTHKKDCPIKEDTLDEPTTENKVLGLLEFYIATRINVFNAFHGQETEDDPELLRLEDIAKNAKQEYDKANEAYIKERERKAALSELEQLKYVMENQTTSTEAMVGALNGVDLTRGLAVEKNGKRTILKSEAIDFSMPNFLNDRLSQLSREVE